jgi:peptidoglycan/LPS O-acetylase OafA/YrhL
MQAVSTRHSYRADIDGLRAIAVLAVIGYHFFPQWVPAGFAGVDVFFVISGYLITGIILEKVEAGRFSLADFYARRIRRIFPALIFVLLAVVAVGWGLLYSDEYNLLGRHIAAGAGFATNILLWSETGYFDPAAETKPLLHLWSLGVEEQFYLVWPLVLAFLCRTPRSRFWAVLGVLGSSLVACIVMTPGHAVPAFYLPIYRFWELMAGAAFAVHPQWEARTQREADLRAWTGLAMLLACAAVISPGVAYPGWRALLPVVGTSLLVSAGPQAFVNRAWLSGRVLVFIGLISYPLYLWHWPLLSLLRIANNNAPVTLARGAVLFAVSLLLAWLTYVVIERPVRNGRRAATKAVTAGVVMVCVAVAGLVLADRGGLPTREVNARDPSWPSRDGRNAADVRAWLVDDCRLPPEEAKLFRRCTRDSRGTERFALLGDSKAEALFHGLVRTSQPQGRWMFLGGSTNHDTVLPVLSDAYRYQTFQKPSRTALRAVEEDRNIETVVIVAATRSLFHLRGADSIDDLPESIYYNEAYEGFSRYVKHLVDAGKKVVIVVDHPTLPDPKRCMHDARVTWHGKIGNFLAIGHADPRCEMSLDKHEQLAAQYRKLVEALRKVAPDRVALFETTPYLCDVARRHCSSLEGGDFLYSFADHVSDMASTRIGQGLNEFLLHGALAPARAARPSP